MSHFGRVLRMGVLEHMVPPYHSTHALQMVPPDHSRWLLWMAPPDRTRTPDRGHSGMVSRSTCVLRCGLSGGHVSSSGAGRVALGSHTPYGHGSERWPYRCGYRTPTLRGWYRGMALVGALRSAYGTSSEYHTPTCWLKAPQMGQHAGVQSSVLVAEHTPLAVYSAALWPSRAANPITQRMVWSTARLARLARRRRRWLRLRRWRRALTETHTQNFFVSNFRWWVNISNGAVA